MLRWMCGHTRLDRIRNVVIREKVRVAPIEKKMRETRLRWFGHVKRRSVNATMRSCEMMDLRQCRRGRGRQKTSWTEGIRGDQNFLALKEDIAQDRSPWRSRIKSVEHR